MTSRISLTALIVIATVVFGFLISKIHLWSPDLFPKPAAYPYADTWVAVSSIVANTLLARRILENWVIWIAVDVVCVYLYFSKDIVFVSFEYLIFLMLAIFGHMIWFKEWRKAETQ
jgi:nicotinamide mononucleotide transporter